MVSAQFLDNYLSQCYHISHANWSWLGHDPYLIWMYYIKSQGHKGHFENNVKIVSTHHRENYLSRGFHISIAVKM